MALRRSQRPSGTPTFGAAAPLSGRRSSFNFARLNAAIARARRTGKRLTVRELIAVMGGRPFPRPRVVRQRALQRAKARVRALARTRARTR